MLPTTHELRSHAQMLLWLPCRLEQQGSRSSLVRAQVKEEGWWLVLGDPDADELLALKRLSFGGRTTTKLVFPANDAGQRRARLSLQLVSDSYAGLDQQFELHLADDGR